MLKKDTLWSESLHEKWYINILLVKLSMNNQVTLDVTILVGTTSVNK